MAMRLEERRLGAGTGERVALVVTPESAVRVARERLEELRHDPRPSPLDEALVAHVRAHGDADRIVVFRGHDPAGEGSWGFDPSLTDAEVDELAYRLVQSELPTYRRLVALGVFALVHVEWGPREVKAYRAATERLLSDLEEQSVPEVDADPREVAVDRVDRWVLRHLTHFYTDGFEEVFRSILLAHLASFEQRIPHLRAMVADLPDDALA
ncbi:MAG: hypothetical protein CMN29_07165 [Sandaracinus sp.]|nr:hypothetical protein [Sandaracinus sp.]